MTTDRPLGDPVPPALAAYYRDLDGNDFDAAASHFAADVLYAVPPPGEIETNPRVEYRGRDTLLAYFRERGPKPYRHEVQLCAVDGSACLLEGVSRDASTDAPFATFVAGAQLDADGSIGRYLAYFCTPAVDPAPTGTDPASADADKVLHQYFTALDEGAFEEAADQFSADVVYSHPPYRHTGIDGSSRVVFTGRDDLLAAFRQRGKTSFDHTIVASVQRGQHCLVEGLVEGLAGGGTGSFISSFTLDEEGRIQRYVSFYCEPGIARR